MSPRAIFGLPGGVDLRRAARVAISAQLDLQNLFNTRFVYNFGNHSPGPISAARGCGTGA